MVGSSSSRGLRLRGKETRGAFAALPFKIPIMGVPGSMG